MKKNSALLNFFRILLVVLPIIVVVLIINSKITADDGMLPIIIAMASIWGLALAVLVVFGITYKSAVKEVEINKSVIASMAGMFALVYIIDLKKDLLIEVDSDEESKKNKFNTLSGSEQLRKMIDDDCEDAYKEPTSEFFDFKTLKERLSNRNSLVFEFVSKKYGWIRARFFAMDRDSDSVVEKIVFAIEDINEEKTEIQKVEDKVALAEHESKAKSAFLANMSHEIRTPINTIIGLDTMILRETTEPEIKSYAKNINSAANMLLALINGILDVSKIEADKMDLVTAEYSFKQFIVEIVNMVKTRAEFERLEFICEVAPNTPDRLLGDNVRLKQVITNLITNAAKYTDKGSVKLAVYAKNHDGVTHLLVSVKDTGIGIKEEDLGKIAQRFSRFDKKRNHSVEGTGIGLNLVTGILALMDSELHVVSTYGEGSEFYFEIDQKIVDEEPIGKINFTETDVDDDEYQALFVAPDAKVLVVDDTPMNLMVFSDLLKETEIQIDRASSGAMALEMASSTKYDVIFMDHMMPEMDGIETFKRLRANENGLNAKTPVVVLTANAVKGAKEEYEEVGFDDFLTKPVQPDLLEKKVMAFVDSSKIKISENKKKKLEKVDITLPSIPGVDTAYGLNHTGGVASYMTFLKQFSVVRKADLEELEAYVQQIGADKTDHDALAAFRIKIHAMKSTANIMGALQVYGLAATLEHLADKKDADAILEMTPYFSEAWSYLGELVEENLPQSDHLIDLPDKDILESQLHLLESNIKVYDIKNSDAIVKKLAEYKWDDGKTELIGKLKIAVANLDADEVLAICSELRR